MAMKIKTQIKVLKEAKERIRSREYYGMCIAIACVLCEGGFWKGVETYIPSFTKEHVTKLCVKNHLELPTDYIFWWDQYDTDIRVKVFDLLIEELESKIFFRITKLFRRRVLG